MTIANNFIAIDGSGIAYAIHATNGSYQNFYYNSAHIAGPILYDNNAFNSACFYTENFESTHLMNNILSNAHGGYTIVAGDGILQSSDYNDLYSTGSNLALWDFGDQSNLAAWQGSSGMDANSISLDPSFNSNTDLHVNQAALNGAANPIAGITDDIDGDSRDAMNPDIGADEFTPAMADAGITAINNPTKPFTAGANNVQVSLFNNAVVDLTSVAIHWEVNGNPQAVHNWTGTLGSGTSTSVNIGSYTFATDTAYSIKAWTSLPNGASDQNNGNDTHKPAIYTRD